MPLPELGIMAKVSFRSDSSPCAPGVLWLASLIVERDKLFIGELIQRLADGVLCRDVR